MPVPRLVLIAALSLAAIRCGTQSSAAPSQNTRNAAPEVTVARVQQAPLTRTVTVNGTLAAEEEVMLSFKVTGRIDELRVDLGSRVQKGEVIARLTPTDFTLREQQARAALQQARARLGLPLEGDGEVVDLEQTSLVRQAKAALEEARVQRDRIQTFVGRGITAKAELDTANANLQIADGKYADALEEVRNRQAVLAQRKSELALASQQLEDTVLRSPIDGVVRVRSAVAGEFRSAGTPVVTVVRQDPLRLQLAVPERSAGQLRTGQLVRVTVEGTTELHEGRVVRLSPSIAEGTRTLAIEASVPNAQGQLRPGSFARADIVVSESRALVVPQSAIIVFAGVEKVLTVEDGAAKERRIKTGERVGDHVEVLDGLAAGTMVITSGGNIADGAKVTLSGESRAPNSAP
jgi:RND family efflux transporter MFP subunit